MIFRRRPFADILASTPKDTTPLIREQQAENKKPVCQWEPYDHNHRIYDFEVDTSAKSPLECAEEIKQFVATNPHPHAFREIKGKMESLHQCLVRYADWVRREGIVSLRDQPDQPELFKILYEETQLRGRDGRESTVILQAMLLLMEGVSPELMDRILRYGGKWSDLLEEHVPAD